MYVCVLKNAFHYARVYMHIVYMHACMYTCIYIWLYTCMNVYKRWGGGMCIYTLYARACKYATYMWLHIHMHTHIHVCV